MINKCLEKGDSEPLLAILQSPKYGLRVVPECAEAYYQKLLEAKNLKTKKGKNENPLNGGTHICRGDEGLVKNVN